MKSLHRTEAHRQQRGVALSSAAKKGGERCGQVEVGPDGGSGMRVSAEATAAIAARSPSASISGPKRQKASAVPACIGLAVGVAFDRDP